jgi:hypothetical protein
LLRKKLETDLHKDYAADNADHAQRHSETDAGSVFQRSKRRGLGAARKRMISTPPTMCSDISPFQQFEIDGQNLERVYDREQRRERADKQREFAPHKLVIQCRLMVSVIELLFHREQKRQVGESIRLCRRQFRPHPLSGRSTSVKRVPCAAPEPARPPPAPRSTQAAPTARTAPTSGPATYTQ